MSSTLKIHQANADVIEARAASLGARPLPLAAGEVAEFKRPASWWLWTAAELFCLVGAGFCFLKFIGA